MTRPQCDCGFGLLRCHRSVVGHGFALLIVATVAACRQGGRDCVCHSALTGISDGVGVQLLGMLRSSLGSLWWGVHLAVSAIAAFSD